MIVTSIAITAYPSVQQAALLGLRDLLEAAGEFTDSGFVVSVVESFADAGRKFDVVVLPPSIEGWSESVRAVCIKEWLGAQHAGGALICSICAGAFLLAETGLLDGRPATTHWELAGAFSDRYPDVLLDVGKLIIDDGDLITAGGLMAWTDLGLMLIARFLGPAVMQQTAKLFLIDPGGREQSYYNLFTPDLSHGDVPIIRVQQWLQMQYHEAVSVPQMAAYAALEERTFLRRFYAGTGCKPSEYLQKLRISEARKQLEMTRNTLGSIAVAVGYSDVSSFSKLFQRNTGLPPGEYRKRFAPTRR